MGQGDSPLKPEYRARWLDIGGGCEMAHREGRGDTWHGVDVLVEGMGSGEPENEWAGGIDPPKEPNIERTRSILVGV